MNEKSEKVLEQYNISINRMIRGRGGIIIATGQGYKLFTQCEKPDKYYERENNITQILKSAGFGNTDTYVRNNEGQLVSQDEDGRRYILKDWFDAKESDVKDMGDMCRAVSMMAYLHMALREAGSELKINPCGETEYKKYAQAELKACQNRKETALRKTYVKHTRELKKAYNYLKQKKGRQTFEQLAFKHIGDYYEEACNASERLMDERFDERLLDAAVNGEISHGSYTYHNVLIGGKDTYVVNFDRYKNECQISDLYQFIRKVMEKYNWENSVFYRLLDEYDRICPLDDNELELLMTLLSYPEKFWKIINQYINSNKSWIPDKNVDKLRKVIEQNERRRELIDKICCVW